MALSENGNDFGFLFQTVLTDVSLKSDVFFIDFVVLEKVKNTIYMNKCIVQI